MSRAASFGDGFFNGVQAINSIYDRRDRRQERADDVAFRNKEFGLKEQELGQKQKVSDAQIKMYDTHSNYYQSGADYNEFLQRRQLWADQLSQAVSVLKHNPEKWNDLKPAVVRAANAYYGGKLGDGKQVVDFRLTGGQSPLTDYDREQRNKQFPTSIVPILSVPDGRGGTYLAEKTMRGSSDPNDPAMGIPIPTFMDGIVNAPDPQAMQMLQETLSNLQTYGMGKGNSRRTTSSAPQYGFKIVRIQSGDEVITARQYPDGRLERVNVNNDGEIIDPLSTGGSSVVDDALSDFDIKKPPPAPAPTNPSSSQVPSSQPQASNPSASKVPPFGMTATGSRYYPNQPYGR